jgi:hypothetical protein
VPGWHERTKELQQQGKVLMVGITQEQHSERCRLFMQWKKMEWPVLVDSLDLLDVSVVPITLLIDEHGIIRAKAPKGSDLEEFLALSYEPPEDAAEPGALPLLGSLRTRARQVDSGPAWLAYGDALFLWGGEARLDEMVGAYEEVLRLSLDPGRAHFRLGTVLRRRFESIHRRPGDFRAAVEQWQAALDLDPNQYIWRRRIQQYGPRLDKPYPFYDWVARAREEITARGDTPVPLPVDPVGAEIARPARSFPAVGERHEEPDPQSRIRRDPGRFIVVETTVVPARVAPGESVRVHVALRPVTEKKAHWNNEAKALVVWVDPGQGVTVDRQYLSVANPDQEVSQETRKLEFEVRLPEGAEGTALQVPAYALYYVCEDVDGTCLYRRQDITVTIPLK